MIELARHIEILLLENDCVIVPELGGFIAHYQPAYYAESDNIYFPPMRTIGFNHPGCIRKVCMMDLHV